MWRDCLLQLSSGETGTSILRDVIIPLLSVLISVLNLYSFKAFLGACLLFLTFTFTHFLTLRHQFITFPVTFHAPSLEQLWSVKSVNCCSRETTRKDMRVRLFVWCMYYARIMWTLAWLVFIFSAKYFQWLLVCWASSLACLPCQEWWAWEWETGVCEMRGSLLYPTPSRPSWASRVELCFMTKRGFREEDEQRKQREKGQSHTLTERGRGWRGQRTQSWKISWLSCQSSIQWK